MDCIIWAANQIAKHHDVISKEELWYENSDNSEVTSTAGEALWKREEIEQITGADLQLNSCNEIFQHGERIIHPALRQNCVEGTLPKNEGTELAPL